MKCIYNAKILIVEEQEINTCLLKAILAREGYRNVSSTDDARQALPLFRELRPDLVLLDVGMSHLHGFEVLAQLGEFTRTDYIPILMLTADTRPENKQRGFDGGAADFISKPFRVAEVALCARNFLRARQLHLRMARDLGLEARVRSRTNQLQAAQVETLERLARAAESGAMGAATEDDEHTGRVAHLAALVAQNMELPPEQVALIGRAAALHDIGKISVPERILLKPGALTFDEFEVMKTHAEAGARLLQGGHCEVVSMAQTIALTHHERWDGSGYPHGLRGEEIPLVGRIVALADVFDALTHERPYKAAWSCERARDEIKQQRGRHFDPAVVDAFLRLETHNAVFQNNDVALCAGAFGSCATLQPGSGAHA